MTIDTITGGCFCGKIRYEIRGAPVLQLICFCTDCLKTTGTSGYGGYMVNESDFAIVAGESRVHARESKEGRTVRRHFCPECGSNLIGVTDFGLVSVAAGTLDDPNHFQPDKKVFVHDAPHWGRVPDELETM